MSIRGLVHRRYIVTLKGHEGEFGGILTKATRRLLIFERCTTVPKTTGATPDDIAGRVFVDRANVAYLQQVDADVVAPRAE